MSEDLKVFDMKAFNDIFNKYADVFRQQEQEAQEGLAVMRLVIKEAEARGGQKALTAVAHEINALIGAMSDGKEKTEKESQQSEPNGHASHGPQPEQRGKGAANGEEGHTFE